MLEIIDKVIKFSEGLSTEKEQTFLQSIRSQYIQKGTLSFGQENWLASLKDKYSPENIATMRLWEASWSDTHRIEAIRVARYYRENPPYFSALVHKVLSDSENFTLSKKEWDKFCENKYAKKIRNEYNLAPKYQVGDCIQIRRKNQLRRANYSNNMDQNIGRVCDRTGFVLKQNAKPVVRAAKGSKIYQILLTGATSPIYAHESDLKKTRMPKK